MPVEHVQMAEMKDEIHRMMPTDDATMACAAVLRSSHAGSTSIQVMSIEESRCLV